MLGLGFVINLLKLYTGYAFVVAFLLQSGVTLLLAMLAFFVLSLLRQRQIQSRMRRQSAVVQVKPGPIYYPRFNR
ncbi:hypothetical protein DV711_16705 [Motiliproteus coralliicola]|uniref:Uncharacterized protein n=1 Tax=Motiliproteus coralliicola TaxID=2283196 RepID=A0A369W8S1_9GAMM|nr:hypothetical protein [Motiliproteus coralliicola]RDE18302.1 hypothetical protein DV711_16705 [Motiliproteus coralliicola]